jgi:stage V sporulation protein SpoVS
LAKSKPIVQTSLGMPVSNGDANHPSLQPIGIIAGVCIIKAIAQARRVLEPGHGGLARQRSPAFRQVPTGELQGGVDA